MVMYTVAYRRLLTNASLGGVSVAHGGQTGVVHVSQSVIEPGPASSVGSLLCLGLFGVVSSCERFPVLPTAAVCD